MFLLSAVNRSGQSQFKACFEDVIEIDEKRSIHGLVIGTCRIHGFLAITAARKIEQNMSIAITFVAFNASISSNIKTIDPTEAY